MKGNIVNRTYHRMRDFRELNEHFSGKTKAHLPEKSIFSKRRLDDEFAEKRRKELDVYLTQAIDDASPFFPIEFASFLQPCISYSLPK